MTVAYTKRFIYCLPGANIFPPLFDPSETRDRFYRKVPSRDGRAAGFLFVRTDFIIYIYATASSSLCRSHGHPARAFARTLTTQHTDIVYTCSIHNVYYTRSAFTMRRSHTTVGLEIRLNKLPEHDCNGRAYARVIICADFTGEL